tara:strand:- start:11932 stop:12411 length:480 start_codon:yes stop_codon:yes gene_type:complete
MPIYSHKKSGVLNTSTRVEVKDGFVQNGEAVIEILQPANSLVTNAYYRQIDAAAFATNTDVGVELGITESGNEIASDATDAVLDGGTSIPANFILQLNGGTGVTWNGGYSVGDASGPAVPAGDVFAADDRTLYFTVTTTDDVVNTQGKYEVIVDFQLFS